MRTTIPLLILATLVATPLAAQDPAPTAERGRRGRGLELSDAQRQQLRELRERFTTEDRAVQQARRQQMEQRQEQLDAVLTPEQRTVREQQHRRAARQLRRQGTRVQPGRRATPSRARPAARQPQLRRGQQARPPQQRRPGRRPAVR